MQKADVVAVIAKEVGITKADAEKAVNWTMRLIADCIEQEGRYAFGGFGVFKKVRRAACVRPNPQKRGEKINIPAHWTVKFKPAPALKALLK
jgi:DNA-binding protein HU-beta